LAYLPEYNITAVALVNERNDFFVTDPSLLPPDSLTQTIREQILLDSVKIVLEEQAKPVPEPSAIAGLILLGASGLLLQRKTPS
jgi:hypothetical protein